MKKQGKYYIIGIALLIIAALAIFFLLPQSFEQEYERMSLAWKEKGITSEHLHGSEELFLIEVGELEEIKEDLLKFSASTQNNAAAEIADAYISLIESTIYLSELGKLREELASSQKPVCENTALFSGIEEKLSLLRESKDEYINKINSFTKKYPKEAISISLNEASLPTSEEEENLETLLEVLTLLEGECK